VRAFSLEIARHLLQDHDIKLLVVACNTATAAALDDLAAALPVPVIGVLEPGVRALFKVCQPGHRVGVIGTVGSIASGAYQAVAVDLGHPGELVACACPGFVEFVERGETDSPGVRILAERLLAPVVEAGVDALLLGCTHYPYLARVISDVMGPEVVLVSSADETAFALAALLRQLDLTHPDPARRGSHRFVSSGDVRAFTDLGSKLLGPELVGAERWLPGGPG
jgi:glutamate racemase